MPNIISRDQLMKSKGIGPSHVASILHCDPLTSAYNLWQQRTGRAPKPETTSAMTYGNEMEPEATEQLRRILNVTGKAQVIAVHPEMNFLRGIADLWAEDEGVLAQIKCPSSRKLLEQVKAGQMPKNYLLQLAAEMSIFGVAEEYFFVYHGPKPEDHELILVNLGDIFEGSTILAAFWETVAVPAIKEFWDRVQTDTWLGDGHVEPDSNEWGAAATRRNVAKQIIEEAEADKDAAEATMKRLMGTAKAASAAGWKAKWVPYKPSWEVSVKCDSQSAMRKVMDALKPLSTVEGVKAIDEKYRPDNLVFRVESVDDNR